MSAECKHLVGGQAVIEGVMMKSPNYYSVAVRKSDGEIIKKTERFNSVTQKYPILKKRFLRGVVVLFETMILGVKTLSYSADIYASDIEDNEKDESRDALSASKINDKEKKEKKEKKGMGLAIAGTMIFSFGLGIVLFVLLPLWLTNLIKGVWVVAEHNTMFNFIDGIIRLVIFLLYVIGISFLKDIRRVFQYHGAEHKSVYAYENGKDLTVENVKGYSTLHPRCGTNFIFIVIILGIFFISAFNVHTFVDKLILRIVILPPLAGISYEVIRLLGNNQGKKWADFFLAPGLLLQRITTNEPDDSQIEVAITALKEVLEAEKQN